MTPEEQFEKWQSDYDDAPNPPQYVNAKAAYLQGRKDATTWIPITDQMPEPGVPVIALVNPNEYGKTYRIRAQWAPAKTLEMDFDAEGGEYDEETDTYYCEESWYETNEYEEIHWNVNGIVTHWQPLPEIPEELKVKP